MIYEDIIKLKKIIGITFIAMLSYLRKCMKNIASFQFSDSQCCILCILVFLLVLVYYNNGIMSSLEEFENPSNMTYYYMEKCKYCKDFNPVWDEFVQKYNGDVVLKKISMEDAGNDLDKYKINSFPTVVLSNDKGDYKVYEGKRTVDGLMKFAGN